MKISDKTKTTIGIIGYGVVGKATGELFKRSRVVSSILKYDKYAPEHNSGSLFDVLSQSTFLFLCLPTPFYKDSERIDLSAFEEILEVIDKEHSGKNVIIKSTVVPGTTSAWEAKYTNTKFAFCPEFLTEANYIHDAKNPDRFIVGSSSEVLNKTIVQLHIGLFDSYPKIFMCGSIEAEIAKYAANCFLATKVMFANEMSNIAEHFGVSWNDQVAKLVTSDSRIGDSHFSVSKDKGFSGKCFPKDTIAILGLMKDLDIDSSVLSAVWEKNKVIRQNHDWLDIPGVVTEKPNKV